MLPLQPFGYSRVRSGLWAGMVTDRKVATALAREDGLAQHLHMYSLNVCVIRGAAEYLVRVRCVNLVLHSLAKALA